MAGNTAGIRTNASRERRRPARSRWRRTRDHLVHNLIAYAVWATYFGLGLATAQSDRYLDIDRAATVTPVISAAAAVLLWPLVFLGVHLRA